MRARREDGKWRNESGCLCKAVQAAIHKLDVDWRRGISWSHAPARTVRPAALPLHVALLAGRTIHTACSLHEQQPV